MIKKRNDLYGEYLVKKFNERFFESYYCSTKEEAKEKAISLIEEGDTVSWGGSQSIFQCGLIDAVKTGNFNIVTVQLQIPLKKKKNLCVKHFSLIRT